MNYLVLLIGGFFFLEGLANLIWWHFFPPKDKTNSKMESVWEVGRFLRTFFGAVLVWVGFDELTWNDYLLIAVVLIIILALALLLYLWTRPNQPQPQPAPSPPPQTCTVPPDRVGNVLKGVYSPERLQVLADCAVAEGTALEVKREHDGDIHIRLKPDPPFSGLVLQGQDFIICEIIPADQASVQTPEAGQHIHVEGPWCFDRIHGWQEIHPVWLLRVLGETLIKASY